MSSELPPETKRCSKCSVVKPFTEFYTDRSLKSGLTSWCKICSSENGKILSTKYKAAYAEENTPEFRLCPKCSQEKPKSDYHVNRNSINGLSFYCKTCEAARNENRKIEDGRGWKSYRMIMGAKKRSSKSNYPFNIDKDFIEAIMPEVCPVLGIALDYTSSRIAPDSPSLDKFYPDLGYIKGNVRVISSRANTMKHNATTEEIGKLYEWMKKTEIEVDEYYPSQQENQIANIH